MDGVRIYFEIYSDGVHSNEDVAYVMTKTIVSMSKTTNVNTYVKHIKL